MSYINKLKTKDLVSLLKFFDCDKEKGARVSIIPNTKIEYEPNTSTILLRSSVDKKKIGLLFSSHGIVNMFKDANPDEPFIAEHSEYGLFESIPSAINFTKSLIGFMSSIHGEKYLKDEFKRRAQILRSLDTTIERIVTQKDDIETALDNLDITLAVLEKDENSLDEYMKTDAAYMDLQHQITAKDEYLQELYNFRNYHTKIQEYVRELGTSIFRVNVATGKKLDPDRFREAAKEVSIGEFQA